MSETPRTDAVPHYAEPATYTMSWREMRDHARQLKRELSAVTVERDALKNAIGMALGVKATSPAAIAAQIDGMKQAHANALDVVKRELWEARETIEQLENDCGWQELRVRVIQAEAERDEALRKQKLDQAQADESTSMAGTLAQQLTVAERQRDEARACLGEAVREAEIVPELYLRAVVARWRKAAGMGGNMGDTPRTDAMMREAHERNTSENAELTGGKAVPSDGDVGGPLDFRYCAGCGKHRGHRPGALQCAVCDARDTANMALSGTTHSAATEQARAATDGENAPRQTAERSGASLDAVVGGKVGP